MLLSVLPYSGTFGCIIREVMQSQSELSNFGTDYQMKTVLDWIRHADIPSNFVMLFDNNRWWAWILQVWDPWRKEDSQCSYWKRRSVQVWGCWTCRLLFVLIFLGELQRDKEYLQSQERFPQPQQGDVVPSHPENGAEDLASNISLYQCYQSGASDLWSRGCRYNLQISRSIVSTSFF